MVDSKEKISTLQLEVIEVASLLVDSFQRDFTKEDQCASHAKALTSYVKHVTKIGMTASVVGFKGFRDICVVFQDSLRTMHAENRILTQEECELLEEWPMLVMSYLSSPSDQGIRLGIIEHIKKLNEKKDVAEEEYDELLTSLSDIRLSEEDLSRLEQLNLPTIQSDTDTDTEVKQNKPDMVVTSLQISQDTKEAIKIELKEILLDLKEPLHVKVKMSETEFYNTLDYCSDRVGILGLSIAETQILGLMDVFLLVQEGLKTVQFDNQYNKFIKQFKGWISCVIKYLEHPGDNSTQTRLVENIIAQDWIEFYSEFEANALLALLVPEIESESITDSKVETIPPVSTTNEVDSGTQYSADESDSGIKNIFIEPENEIIETSVIESSQENQQEREVPVESSVTEEKDNDNEVENSENDNIPVYNHNMDEAVIELTGLVCLDIESNSDEMTHYINVAKTNDDPDLRKEALINFSTLLGRFRNASSTIGLDGLAGVFGVIKNNVDVLIDCEVKLSTEISDLLSAWQEYVLSYLKSLDDESHVNHIISYLCDEYWRQPLDPDLAIDLGLLLLSPTINFGDEPEPRKLAATSEDVSLILPDDVNTELLETLLAELPNYTEEFSRAVSSLINGKGTLADVAVAQRVAHTLKGSANTVGVTGIATLTHHIEDILLAFTNNEQLPGVAISDVLMRAADTLEVMSESLLGMGSPPQDAIAVLQQILNLANQIDSDGIPDNDSFQNLDQAETRPEESLNNVSEPVTQEPTENILRVPASLIDELLRLSGESVIVNSQLQERLRHTLQQNNIIQQQNSLLQNLTFELEQLVDVQGFASQEAGLVNTEFDSLEMDQYNELHTVTRRLIEATTDTQEMSFAIEHELNTIDTLLVAQSRQNKSNQNVVMQTRMVQVKSIVPRLSRSVRQTARLTDKEVNLVVSGEETLVDSEVLNNLIDPLMHVLRNAVDHGLEHESLRLESGKEVSGKIALNFKREGDQFIVECTDDGAGLNYESIRNKAIENKYIEVDQETTEDELQRIILRQGFTTSDSVTQVSGRGIGMDAVHTKVLAMKGALNISSITGKGCTIELRLPVTFISEHALLIKLRGQQLALSSRGIEQILHPGAGQLLENGDSLVYQQNDETIEACYLDVVLNMGHQHSEASQHTRPVLQVRRDSGELYAVVIDEVAASQELVIKPLGDYVPQVKGLDGATILGDGSVVPVIDLPELLRGEHDSYIDVGITSIEPDEKVSRLCALVVDDSLSARRSLAEFVMDCGYEVITARDGLDAIEVLAAKTPDIVLADLEMPRMNGLELSQHIRAHTEIQHIPIIMITSRSTEKHRIQAESAGVNVYMTKPFPEDKLLQAIENELKLVAEKVAV